MAGLITYGRELEVAGLYNLRTDLLDREGNAVRLADGRYLIQNGGDNQVFLSVQEDGLTSRTGWPSHELSANATWSFGLDSASEIYCWVAFGASRISVSPA